MSAEIRCPACGKRLFDVEEREGSLSIVIVCRCRRRLRVVFDEKNSPLLVQVESN